MRIPPDPRFDEYNEGPSALPGERSSAAPIGARMGARYGGAPSATSPRLESKEPSSGVGADSSEIEWRGWACKDSRGYLVRLVESGDGYRAQLTCVDKQGRSGVLLPQRGPVQNPPPGTNLLSYGGGLLDPTTARALAKALLAYADEREERE
jgi:hypothetical protein